MINLNKGDRLWFVDNHTGKIDKIVVTGVSKKQFSFLSKRHIYKCEFSAIGTKYFFTKDQLMEALRDRAAARTKEK